MEWTIFGPVVGLPILGPAVLSLAWTAFWIWMIVDAIQRDESAYPGTGENRKLLWIVGIALLHVVAAVYFFVVFAQSKRGVQGTPPAVVSQPPSQDAA